MNVPSPFPWQLRLEHEGAAAISLERQGRRIRFDPRRPVDADDIVILTGNWPEHVQATLEAVQAGLNPTVVAAPEIVKWLAEKGALQPHEGDAVIDGVQIQTEAYQPIPKHTPKEFMFKVGSALVRPDRAARRLVKRARLPDPLPRIVQLTFPDGSRFLHLHLSLHKSTPADWLERAIEKYGGADWVVIGVDHEEADAVRDRIGRFGGKHILFTDLIAEVRRHLGLPTNLLTPLVDQVLSDGVAAYVLVSQACFRFE